MNYQETTAYLFSQLPMFEKQGATGFKEGLANTLALDEHFGHPHRNYVTIHVAGTNGKGSVAHSIAAVLQACGLQKDQQLCFGEFTSLVQEKIIAKGLREEICGDCQWSSICAATPSRWAKAHS